MNTPKIETFPNISIQRKKERLIELAQEFNLEPQEALKMALQYLKKQKARRDSGRKTG